MIQDKYLFRIIVLIICLSSNLSVCFLSFGHIPLPFVKWCGILLLCKIGSLSYYHSHQYIASDSFSSASTSAWYSSVMNYSLAQLALSCARATPTGKCWDIISPMHDLVWCWYCKQWRELKQVLRAAFVEQPVRG